MFTEYIRIHFMCLKFWPGGGWEFHHLAGESLDFWAEEETKVLVTDFEEEGSEKGS